MAADGEWETMLLLCLGCLVLAIDLYIKRREGSLSTWHVKWTHWSYTLTLGYLALVTLPAAAFGGNGIMWLTEQLRSAAWGCTLSVNVGYWFGLVPMRIKKSKKKNNTEDAYTFMGVLSWPVGIAKHGGSLLWLIAEFCDGQTYPKAWDLSVGFLLAALGLLYLANARRHWKLSGKWPYGKAFGKPPVQLGFLCILAVLYPAVTPLLPMLCRLSAGVSKLRLLAGLMTAAHFGFYRNKVIKAMLQGKKA